MFYFFRTPVAKKEKAEMYPKNQGMLKMAKKFADKMKASIVSEGDS